MHRRLVGALVASAVLLTVPALAQEYHYVKVAEIYLPCQPGRGDWVLYDPTNQMVYVSMHEDGMAVIDTRTNAVVHVIKDIPDPNTMTFDSNYVYETAAEGLPQGMNGSANATGFGTRNEIVVIDKHTWQIVGRTETWPHGTTPDGTGYANGRVYAAMDDNNVMDVFTAGANPQFVAQWDLYPQNTNHWWLNTADYTGPDAFYVTSDGRKIFESADQYEEIVNAETGAVEAQVDTGVPLTSKGGTKGSWLDEKTNQLWLATTSKKDGLLILDGNTLRVIKRLPATTWKDQLSVDPVLGVVYTFGGSGFDAYDINTETHIAYVNIHVGKTHSGDVSSVTHAVYAYGTDRASVSVYCPVAGPGPNGDWATPIGRGVPCGSGASPVAAAEQSYTVYFAFNSANLTPDARRIVHEAAISAKQGTARLEVDGYADLSGTAQYNLGLSMRRANAVRAELIADGIAAQRVTVHAFGKTHPAVPTPDGVREPRNRRAVVLIGPASMS